MERILVRLIEPTDFPMLLVMDASYHTDFVWQMEVAPRENQFGITFREVKLPRSMRVDYPRSLEEIIGSFKNRDAVFVATLDGELIGFVSVVIHPGGSLAQATDLIVSRRYRRRGVGSTLIRFARRWALQNASDRFQLEMQSKNFPAIELANQLGFEFCGYSDQYYKNQDIALFFMKRL